MFKVILFDEEVLWFQGRVDPKRRKSTFKAWRGRLLGQGWGEREDTGILQETGVSEAGNEEELHKGVRSS